MAAYPIADATKVHLDAATDDPSQARAELVSLIDKFNELLALLSQTPDAAEIPVLNANGVLVMAKPVDATADVIVFSDGSKLGAVRVNSKTGSDAAIMTFHRPGVSTNHFGVDVDGILKYGGAGGSVHRIWHSGNGGTGSGLDADTVRGKVVNFRGALVYNNMATADLQQWFSESYDTDSLHSTSNNRHLLTVPSGATRVRLSAQIRTDNVAAVASSIMIAKSSGGTVGQATSELALTAATQSYITRQVHTPVLNVTAGDSFYVTVSGASSVADADGATNWFAMEIVE